MKVQVSRYSNVNKTATVTITHKCKKGANGVCPNDPGNIDPCFMAKDKFITGEMMWIDDKNELPWCDTFTPEEI